MPNWCSNELRVSFDHDTDEAKKQYAEFRQCVTEACTPNAEKGLFNLTIPRPAILDQTISGCGSQMETPEYKEIQAKAIAETGHKDWYEWSCAMWGTKWDACEINLVNESDDNLEVHFETAWSPPSQWLEAIRIKYPDLTFWMFYREDGCEAVGYL
ncbi:hypothetical protein ABIC09_002177 [Bradyrhizobium sp. S3.12.5]|uniref:DUF1281 family ferredoxin-like fold protein n=1 Tax=Bradyrhizobium sp. S3.12.5 TaxID=3156386 RepID=UPI0033929552